MKAVVTRVKSASVAIEGEIHGQIGQGFLILLGIAPDDTPENAASWPRRSSVCACSGMKMIR